MKEKIDALVGDRLTASKAADICERMNFEVTGVVMTNKQTGENCIIKLSAVRWLSKEKMWELMHTDAF